MYAPTFFPNATRLEEAQSILVAPGHDVFSVDFALLMIESFTISGIVTDPTGEPLAGVEITMLPLGPSVSGLLGLPQPVADDGRFVLTNVAPGAYGLLLNAPGTQR